MAPSPLFAPRLAFFAIYDTIKGLVWMCVGPGGRPFLLKIYKVIVKKPYLSSIYQVFAKG